MTSVLVLATLFVGSANAQELALPALSPAASVSQTVGTVEITVSYSSPAKRGRQIWGDVVPYGELWRTGANAATTFETTGDVVVGGVPVPAGKYAVFTIPGETEWTFILNRNPNQSGTAKYDPSLDQARVTVVPEPAPERERLTFLFDDTDEDGTELELTWAGLSVSVPVQVDTPRYVASGVDHYVLSASGRLADAARYYGERGQIDRALELIEKSLAVEETWYNTWLKASWLHEKGKHKDAYKLAQRAKELGAGKEGFFFESRVDQALATWPKR